MGSTTNQPTAKTTVFTVISYVSGIALFILCIFLLFGKTCAGSVDAGTPANAGDSSLSVTKKDTIKTEAGKSTIITAVNNSTVKYSTKTSAGSIDDIIKRLDGLYKYFLLIFGVFILLLVLPRLKTFDISATGVKAELNDIAKAINEVQGQAVQQADEQIAVVRRKLQNANLETMNAAAENNDPQNGVWGGSDTVKNRRLTASIKKIIGSEWADITLCVESTDPKKPLTGIVYFHLHPTFPNPDRVIIVVDGKAQLNIKAWGAFTVGAECDDKQTKLELDLAKQQDAFEPFKSR